MHRNGGQPARAPESMQIRYENMADGVRYEGVCSGTSHGVRVKRGDEDHLPVFATRVQPNVIVVRTVATAVAARIDATCPASIMPPPPASIRYLLLSEFA